LFLLHDEALELLSLYLGQFSYTSLSLQRVPVLLKQKPTLPLRRFLNHLVLEFLVILVFVGFFLKKKLGVGYHSTCRFSSLKVLLANLEFYEFVNALFLFDLAFG